MQLTGKTAFVTGATSGIGKATAILLAEQGASVAICGRRADRLEETAASIASRGGTSLALEMDVTVEEDCKNAVARAADTFGSLDILVNNAGVMLLGPIHEANTQDWRRMVETNVMGLLYCTHAALPYMTAAKSGHIINISSTAGRTVRAGAGVYNLTKWGVNAFSEALRQEVYSNNIRVTIVEPGIVATELRDHITHQQAKSSIETLASSITQLTPEDVARAILYAATQPSHVNVNEILMRPTEQAM